MAALKSQMHQIAFFFFLPWLIQFKVFAYQFKVGDLNAWGVPSPGNSRVYSDWAKKQHFQIGDSLFFLYPPSQDSVVQVTGQAFKSCSISDPILYMKDGNSLFNITSTGKYYFTSGAAGHCQKGQKLEVLVGVGSYDESSLSPSSSPPLAPGASPSYANAFGSIPTSSSTSLGKTWDLIVFVVGFAIALMEGI